MTLISYEKPRIAALAGCVPSNIIRNLEYTKYFSEKDVAEIVEKTGIYERRFAPDGMCASDLCYAAAERLIEDNTINKEEVDLLVFVSQTPDYRMPATSVVLQKRLGLGNHVAAFDINLGCSAFIYGLSVVYAMMETGGFRSALLLDGETRSRVYSAKDRKTAFIFGDGAVAAWITADSSIGKSFFSLNSDGGRADYIKMNAGGYRNPSTPETLKERVVDEHGNIRSEEHGYMNGADVFNFVIAEIPKDIKRILAFSATTKEEIDLFFFHQANSYMNGYLANKLKLEREKVPNSIAKFGNTSSVSIPLNIVDHFQGTTLDRKRSLMSGFGVGMSWASCVMDWENCKVSTLVELS